MAIADYVSVAANGNIRWTGSGSTSYTVLECIKKEPARNLQYRRMSLT